MRLLVAMLLFLSGCAVHGQRVAPHSVDWPVHHVQTDDGATIALQRRARPGRPAVVLCHGISSNHHFWDLQPGRSLAEYLYDAGYDVWNLDLRGHGLALRGADGRRPKPTWNVDDYATSDLPAAFDYVSAHTDDAPLHYVGHSLGGMVLAIYLSHNDEPAMHSAVVVGSPLEFRSPDGMTHFLLSNAHRLRFIRRLPTGVMAHALALMGSAAPFKADAMLFSRDNLAPAARRRTLRWVVSPMVVGEISQLTSTTDGRFRSADAAIAYADELADVRIPMLFFAGRADHIAPPDGVRAYFDAVGSPNKELVIASRSNGFHADYGHLDLGVGDHVQEDVFSRIVTFLKAQAPTP